VRSASAGAINVTVAYEEVAYERSTAAVPAAEVRRRAARRLANYPNPFNPRTTIELTLPTRPGSGGFEAVAVRIYDTSGRLVTTFSMGSCRAGRRTE